MKYILVDEEEIDEEKRNIKIIKCTLILKAIKLLARIAIILPTIESRVDSHRQRFQINEYVRR